MNGMIGKKIGMTQIFTDNGDEVPVTVLEMGPCPVVQVKTVANDGYVAAQLAFEPIEKKDKKKYVKPQEGHFKLVNLKPYRFVREFRIEEKDGEVKPGDVVKVDMFTDIHYVSVIGVSKGKGYSGVMKRYGFKGFPGSRGTHEFFRHGGSIGNREFPGRVMPGKKMAGRHGGDRVKVLNLEVMRIFPEQNLLLVRGAVPGANGSMVMVERSDRRQRSEAKAAEAKFVNPLKASKKKSGK